MPRTTTRRQRGSPLSARTRGTATRATKILNHLEAAHPEAECALKHKSAFELLVATILSAQCTDQRVNLVTPALFRAYPTPAALAAAHREDLQALIRSTGFFRAKAKNLMACAAALVSRHGGRVPKTLAELVKLPGIGRKTANVVLGHAFGVAEGIAVDTHVLRVSSRLGLAEGDPAKVEMQLMSLIPKERWTRTTDLLIFHGRKVCDARRPRCGECPVFSLCRWESRQAYASRVSSTPSPRAQAVGRPNR